MFWEKKMVGSLLLNIFNKLRFNKLGEYAKNIRSRKMGVIEEIFLQRRLQNHRKTLKKCKLGVIFCSKQSKVCNF